MKKHLLYAILCLFTKFNSRQNICFLPYAKLNSRQFRQILFSLTFLLAKISSPRVTFMKQKVVEFSNYFSLQDVEL